MAVADSWEHTWRTEMIVSGADDDAHEVEPAVPLSIRIGLLGMVGLVAAGALTAHVRLHVLRAEERRLEKRVADMKATTELMRCQVATTSAPALISAYADEQGLRPPVSMAEIGPPAPASRACEPECATVGSELRHASRVTAQNAANRLGAILRGPAAGH
ncbi:MAG: hypothetical protein ACE5JM_16710 [Armatimonadota bacterium]